ncbi:MAG: hypothetical protein MJH10_10320 [Epibacterium sp.]|nr:hypothetical protein [Epibacterium sp.]NQX73934.1 hypothetical protein [Epibacterium sp.]
MSTSLEDALNSANAEAVPEPVAEEVVQEQPEPVAKEVASEPEEVAKEIADSVPHGRFNAVNERNKELEAELAELRKAAEAPRAAPDLSHLFTQGEGDKLPDPIDDAAGYQAAIEQRFNDRLYQQGWNVSQTAAIRHFGESEVNGALSAFAEQSKVNPLLQQAAKQSPDPVGEIVNWHKQQQAMQTVQQAGGLEAYRKQVEAEIRAQMGQAVPEPTPTPAQPAPAMPSDMATARSAGPRDGAWSPTSLDAALNAPR